MRWDEAQVAEEEVAEKEKQAGVEWGWKKEREEVCHKVCLILRTNLLLLGAFFLLLVGLSTRRAATVLVLFIVCRALLAVKVACDAGAADPYVSVGLCSVALMTKNVASPLLD